jgi:elongation factor Ts
MAVTAEAVKALRERTGAGMMECKKALVETNGDLEAAAEIMRKSGLAKADKKAGRVAAEGVVVIERAADGRQAAIVEVNSETDFVAREKDFQGFAADVARVALATQPADLDALLAAKLPSGSSVEETRRALIARIGENIGVRRFELIRSDAPLATYSHGTRIGVVLALVGGADALGHDLAMHIAALNPPTGTAGSQVAQDPKAAGKPADIVAKMVDGKIRKYLSEITLLGQPFVKDDKQSVEQVLKKAGARVARFVRFEVGAGIEKRQENFAEEVAAAVRGA